MLARVSFAVAIGALIAKTIATIGVRTRQATCTTPLTSEEDGSFDDIKGVTGNLLNPIPDPYHGIYWQGFTYGDVAETDLLPGVLPHSSHGYAVAEVLSTTLQGTAMMTVNFQDSNGSTFDLHSLYYGSSLQLFNGATALPMPTYIDITGYNGPDNSDDEMYEVCSQQLTYDPTTFQGPQQMAYAEDLDSCFSDMTHAIFTYSFEGGAQALNALIGIVLDEVEYTLHYCEP